MLNGITGSLYVNIRIDPVIPFSDDDHLDGMQVMPESHCYLNSNFGDYSECAQNLFAWGITFLCALTMSLTKSCGF